MLGWLLLPRMCFCASKSTCGATLPRACLGLWPAMTWISTLFCSLWLGRLPLLFVASAGLGPSLLTPLVDFPLSPASPFFKSTSGLGMSCSMGSMGSLFNSLRLPLRGVVCGSLALALFELSAHTWLGSSLPLAGFATPCCLPALGAFRVWISPFHPPLAGGSRSGCSTPPSCRLSRRPSFYVSPIEFISA